MIKTVSCSHALTWHVLQIYPAPWYMHPFSCPENMLIASNFTGPIINDLSNGHGCDFGSPIIDYTICLNSGSSTNCFATPCGNGRIYTSFCNQSQLSQESVSLQVNGAENGTVVSIFCSGFDCTGQFSNIMLFNIRIICKFTYNASVSCYQYDNPQWLVEVVMKMLTV